MHDTPSASDAPHENKKDGAENENNDPVIVSDDDSISDAEELASMLEFKLSQ